MSKNKVDQSKDEKINNLTVNDTIFQNNNQFSNNSSKINIQNPLLYNNSDFLSLNNNINILDNSSSPLAVQENFWVRVLYNYSKQSLEELNIREGQYIFVKLMYDDGWWLGELFNEIILSFDSQEIETKPLGSGLFPSNFTKIVD